jgi:glycine cleavage system transcriptional repressor
VQRFSLTAVGTDRPGIVAAVSGALVDQGCNLEDSAMTILQGQFAVLLVVSAPDQLDADELRAALGPAAERFDLILSVRALAESDPDPARPPADAEASAPSAIAEPTTSTPSATAEPTTSTPKAASVEPWTVSIHGADHTGIVHRIATALADVGGNIVDLGTHLVGDERAPVYVMTIRVTLPAGAAGDAAAESVRRAAADVGVHGTLHRDDAEVL